MAPSEKSADQNSPQGRRLRPKVLNPFERGTKFRIFILVAMLMLILAVAERARDPQSWRWLQNLDRPAPELINNRVLPKPSPTAGDDLDTLIFASPNNSVAPTAHPASAKAIPGENSPTFDPAERAWVQGWKQVYEGLEADQKSLLYRILLAPLDLAGLPDADRVAGEPLLSKLDRNWSDYAALAFQSIATLEGDDKARWIEVIDRVNRRWRDELQPSLAAILVPRVLTAAERKFVTEYLAMLDALQLASIQDDSLFRTNENQIFFRLFKDLALTAPADLQARSTGELTYLQLFKQPEAYRGKLITVRGTVKLAYQVPAFENQQGIKTHYVFWIYPGEGVTSPIVVYTLEVPPGFPPLPTKYEAAPLGKPSRRWDQDVELTGYFFKRWAYPGKGATFTAPLIFARSVNPLKATASQTSAGGGWWGLYSFWGGLGIAFALATMASLVIFFLAFRNSPASVSSREQPVLPRHWEELSPFGPPPSIAENLRRLRDERDRHPSLTKTVSPSTATGFASFFQSF